MRPDDRLELTLTHTASGGRAATLTPAGPAAARWLTEVQALAARH
jgi:hypothetical protein